MKTDNNTERVELDYFGKMKEAMEIIGEGHALADILKAEHIFKEINDYVQDVPIFDDSRDQHAGYVDDMVKEFPVIVERIEKCWIIFLHKVVEAPTYFHRIGCVIFQIPVIYTFIKEYRNAQEFIRTAE